jgi:hypothetical protein
MRSPVFLCDHALHILSFCSYFALIFNHFMSLFVLLHRIQCNRGQQQKRDTLPEKLSEAQLLQGLDEKVGFFIVVLACCVCLSKYVYMYICMHQCMLLFLYHLV